MQAPSSCQSSGGKLLLRAVSCVRNQYRLYNGGKAILCYRLYNGGKAVLCYTAVLKSKFHQVVGSVKANCRLIDILLYSSLMYMWYILSE